MIYWLCAFLFFCSYAWTNSTQVVQLLIEECGPHVAADGKCPGIETVAIESVERAPIVFFRPQEMGEICKRLEELALKAEQYIVIAGVAPLEMLPHAVVSFLQRHPEWHLCLRWINAEGVAVLKKRKVPQGPQFYDCFPFYNELDLLEVKLHELATSVDYFVIVESIETFQGNPKPLFFLENRKRFAPFLDQIVHVILDEKIPTSWAWEREINQRNGIARGLLGCQEDDIILVEDADEIVLASAIPHIKKVLHEEQQARVLCELTYCMWYINVIDDRFHPLWRGPVACTYRVLKTSTPHFTRQFRFDLIPRIEEAGWHFSYLGGTEQVVLKVRSFSHTLEEFQAGFDASPEEVLSKQETFIEIPITEHYPQFIRDHLDRWKKAGWLFDKRLSADQE